LRATRDEGFAWATPKTQDEKKRRHARMPRRNPRKRANGHTNGREKHRLTNINWETRHVLEANRLGRRVCLEESVASLLVLGDQVLVLVLGTLVGKLGGISLLLSGFQCALDLLVIRWVRCRGLPLPFRQHSWIDCLFVLERVKRKESVVKEHSIWCIIGIANLSSGLLHEISLLGAGICLLELSELSLDEPLVSRG
jgi:hypothetical protein